MMKNFLLQIGKEIIWEGSGVDEVGKEKDTGTVRIKVNPKYYRPAEVVSISMTLYIFLIVY